MALLDEDTRTPILGDFEAITTAYASASAAYDAWAAELGVSSTATISAFSADDDFWMLSLGFPVAAGSQYASIGVASESGLSIYYGVPSNAAKDGTPFALNLGAASVSRMFASVSRPSLLVAIRGSASGLDMLTEGAKWQKAGQTAILFYRARYLASQTEIVDVALRLTPGRMELVATNVNASSPKIQAFRFCESNNVLVRASVINSGFTGTVEYRTSLPKSVSGVVRNDAGSPVARAVRLYDRTTGALIGVATSDAGTGAYTFPAVFQTAEVQRVVLDDDAGALYNDLIDRVIPG